MNLPLIVDLVVSTSTKRNLTWETTTNDSMMIANVIGFEILLAIVKWHKFHGKNFARELC